MTSDDRELAPGLWQFCAEHPDWTEQEGGQDGWDPLVGWYAASTARGLLLTDPLVTDFDALDQLVGANGGCAGIVRTIHWHQRSIAEVADRYSAAVWAGVGDPGEAPAPDHALEGRAPLWDGIEAFALGRADEIALWLPAPAALVFGDGVLGREGGLRLCPESWTQPPGGHEQLRATVRALGELPIERVLVSHGQSAMTGGAQALTEAAG